MVDKRHRNKHKYDKFSYKKCEDSKPNQYLKKGYKQDTEKDPFLMTDPVSKLINTVSLNQLVDKQKSGTKLLIYGFHPNSSCLQF